MTMKDVPCFYIKNAPGTSLDVSVAKVSSATTAIQSAATAGTEYTYSIPSGTKKAMLRLEKGNMEFRYNSSDPYFVIARGSVLEIPNLELASSLTFLFKSDKDSDNLLVELES